MKDYSTKQLVLMGFVSFAISTASLIGITIALSASDTRLTTEKPAVIQKKVKPSPSPSSVKKTAKPSPKSQVEPKPKQTPLLAPSPTLAFGSPLRSPVSGSCQCPYDRDKWGKTCGERAAYSQPSGERPKCYVSNY
jgi:hypothetical protein